METAGHEPPALVLGAHVNSLSVARELGLHGVEVWMLHYRRGLAHASRFVERSFVRSYLGDDDLLLQSLLEISAMARSRPVLIPTHDHHVLFMAQNEDVLRPHFLMSLNRERAEKIVSKQYQYELCERTGVPYPATVCWDEAGDIETFLAAASRLGYPLVVRPFSRAGDCGDGEAFRLEVVHTAVALEALLTTNSRMREGRLMASEIVPGAPDNIWAYTAFVPISGQILAGWTGRKLTQRPPGFGVFASAESRINPTVDVQGHALLESSGHAGMAEIEFKYDSRDGRYKLMEINPRLGMWHMCGYLAGVNLPLIQYRYLIGDMATLDSMQKKQNDNPVRFVFAHHEFLNLHDQKPKMHHMMNLVRALLCKNKRFALFWKEDSSPWLFHTGPSVKAYIGSYVGAVRRRLRRISSRDP